MSRAPPRAAACKRPENPSAVVVPPSGDAGPVAGGSMAPAAAADTTAAAAGAMAVATTGKHGASIFDQFANMLPRDHAVMNLGRSASGRAAGIDDSPPMAMLSMMSLEGSPDDPVR